MVIGPEGDSAVSLADFAGQLLGEATADETPEPQTTGDAAGAPLAEHPTDDSAPAPLPEGTEPAELAGAPPADADAPVPDTASPVAEPDPLATATPLTYTVNGEQRTYEGIKALDGGKDGAYIAAADLPDVIRRMGERDHLFETNRAQYAQVQQLEKLAEWQTTGADGQPVTYQGQRGIVEMRLENARLAAENAAFESVFADPARYADMLIAHEDGTFTLNPEKIQLLALHADRATRAAQDKLRSDLQQRVQTPTTSAEPDFAKIAPAIIAQFAVTAGVDATALTEKDTAFLGQVLPRYARSATAQDVQANPALRLGQRVIDPSFAAVVKDRYEMRSESAKVAEAAKTETSKLASVVANAAKQNAAKLTAAARIIPSASVTPGTRRPVRQASDDAPRANPSDAKWDFWESMTTAQRAG